MAPSREFFTNQTLSVDTDAYTAGDVVGGLLTFSNAMPSGAGLLNTVVLIDADGEEAAFTLWLFNALPSTIADDAAFDLSVANANKVIASITIDTYTTLTTTSVAVVNPSPNVQVPGVFYGYLVCTATPTYTAATDLSLTVAGITT